MNNPTITVLGAGYVGLTTAAVFSHAGFAVYVVEPNAQRLSVIKKGKAFFYEEGMDELVGAGVKSGKLIPTDSYEECVPKSDFVFSCVGTPDNPDGSSNLTYVFSSAETAAKLMKPGAIYVQKSTVPVGTGRKVMALFEKLGKKFPYVSNPEFMRESTAIYDTLYFDRVVTGSDNLEAAEKVLNIYRQLEAHRDQIAALAGIATSTLAGPYVATKLNSAELIKVTSNAFLALKISFANSVAMLADKAGADIVEVMDIVGADQRIVRAFLNAGRGYGGGCFPKDVSGLISSGLEHGVNLEIMEAAQAVNQAMPGYIVEKLREALGGSLEGKKVAVLGLAFKAGTSDARRSPGIVIANILNSAGAQVTGYDPQAREEAAEELDDDIAQHDSLEAAAKGTDAIVVATEWAELVGYPASSYAKLTSGILVDAVNKFTPDDIRAAGLTYIGVGRS